MPNLPSSASPPGHETAYLNAQGLMEESAEDLYEHAPCGYLSCLPDGTVVKVNATLLRWLGYERAELLHQRRFQHLLTVGGRIHYETHFGPLLQLQGAVNEISCQLLRKDGSRLPVLVNAVQLADAGGQPLLRRITVFSAPDRHRYEQELLRAKREAEAAAELKARFVSVMSHELRTPLHAILSLVELLLEEPDGAKRLAMKQVLKVATEDLLALFNQVLDYQKLTGTAAALAQEPLNLRNLMQRVLAPLAVRAEAKGLALRTNIGAAVPAVVLGDGVKLQQVLTNLVGNAVKFTEHGSVTVSLDVEQRLAEQVTLRVAVRDTGIGIAASKLALIFEEYQQADYAINLQYGGTGLGLAISQQLVKLFGSRIEVRSELNQGTEFFFRLTLPVVQTEITPAPDATRASELPPLPGLRVLVADDNRYNVFVLRQYLNRWQVSYDVVDDGAQALRQVQTAPYHLVLLDLQMPVLDGFGALRGIRAVPGLEHLPVVAQSAREPAALRQQLAGTGFTGYLAKPFRAEELHAVLATYAPTAPAAPLPTPTAGAVPTPGFSLEGLRELTDDSPADFLLGLQLLLDNMLAFETYCAQLLAEPATRQPVEFSQHAHRLKMTLHHLGAEAVQAQVTAVRDLFNQNATAAEVEPVLQDLHAQAAALVQALRQEREKADS